MSSLLHVVLAAHGAGNGSASNLRVSACAERLAMAVPEIEVTAAFHLGSPTLPEVLEQTPSRDFLVIPMLTTDGYFARRIRQQVFACSARGCRPTVHAPIGTHPALIDLMLKDLREILDKRDPMDRPFEILVIGHGTKRHQRSRHATSHVALRLARETPSVVRAAFLDDAPTVEETLERIAPATTLLVVPFLFGGGVTPRPIFRIACRRRGAVAAAIPFVWNISARLAGIARSIRSSSIWFQHTMAGPSISRQCPNDRTTWNSLSRGGRTR